MRLLSWLCAFAAFVGAAPAKAQDTIVRTETTYFVQTAGGSAAVCGLEFNIVYRDRTIRNGAAAAIGGSFSWAENKGNIGLLLKINGADFPNLERQDVRPQQFSIAKGAISIKGNYYAPDTTSRCEDPRAFCGTYWIPKSLVALQELEAGNLSVSFNREAGGLDVTLPIHIEFTNEKMKDYSAFHNCMSVLSDRAIKSLNK
jgi:hypothetical protein